MSQEVDWLRSQAGLCKVDLYNPEAQKDQDHKVLCFVDVSSLNMKDKDPKAKQAASQSSNLSERSNEFDLEEKEVIVVKDNLKHDHSKTEGTVCLFKQGSGDEFSVIRWLNNDLQKYAAGFQHALTSSDNPPKHKGSNTSINLSLSRKMAQNSDTSLKSLGAQKGNRYPEDISCYINKLCSLVVQMAHKEITDKLEGTASKCMQQAIQDSSGEGKSSNPHSSGNNPASEMVNESPQANTSTPHGKLPSSKATQDKTTKQEDDPRFKKTSLFYGEMSQQKGCNEGEKSSNKQLCQQAKTSRQDDFGTSVSKGLMVYANQVASDVMVSFLKTMKVEKKGNKHVPACMVLKKVVLKHTRDVISDLIDSTMKNLHSVTSVLMTDSDFVATVKRNLFNMGSQKSTEILEAMVRRLYNILLSEPEKSRSQSLAYTILKAGFPPDSKSQSMQFAAMKTQTQGTDKEKANPKIQTCAENVSEHMLKEGVTRLHAKTTCTAPDKAKGGQEKNPETTNSTEFLAKDLILTSLTLIQQHLLQQATKQMGKDSSESGATSLGYVSRDSRFEKAGTSQSSRSLAEASGSRPAGTRNDYQQQFNSQKGDVSSVFLSIIQKVLCEAGLNTEDSSSDTNKSLKHIPASDCESSRQAIAKQPNSAVDQVDNMDQVNKQFIDQLVESAMKLCLLMVKGSGTDLATGDSSEEPNVFGASSAKAHAQATPRRASQSKQNGNPLTGPSSGSQVIVTNQNANSSSQNKELQAILQWVVASQFNVPNLSFMHGNEEDVKKLPLLAEKAAKKGYSVGDILQEVMRYYEKQQFDTAVGNTTCFGLMDWLLNNL